MEKKQLNFSTPLMSARRYSSPMRPSREENQRHFPSKYQKKVQSQHSYHDIDEVVKPGSVPFVWEQIPGKSKGGNNEPRVLNPQELPSTPKLPPYRTSSHLTGLRTPSRLSEEATSLRHHNKFSRFSGELHPLKPYSEFLDEIKIISDVSWKDVMVSSKEGTKMNVISEYDYDDSAFSDALETLSQLESFSVNCSMSGLHSSETVCNAENTRGFMMDRFLPAAKAMTIEPSQYASRKQLMDVDQPKEVKALVSTANTPPSGGSLCHIVPYTGQDIGSEGSEEEGDDSSYDGQSGMSVTMKYRRFLPWFCSTKSLCPLNPLPTNLKHKSKISASKISRIVKSGSSKSHTQNLDKVPCSYPNRKVCTSFKSCELQKPPYTSRPMFYSGELQTRSGSPYRSFRRRVESPRSLYQSDDVDSLSKLAQKNSKRYEESRGNSRLSGTTRSPMNITKVSHSNSSLPKTEKLVDDFRKENESSSENAGRMEIMKTRGSSGHLEYNGVNTNVYSPKIFSGRKSELFEHSKMSSNGNLDIFKELLLVAGDVGDTTPSPLTPPLPKSPSDSWLSRNLASASPRNSSFNLKLQSRKQNAK